jgi:hypothetical protein
VVDGESADCGAVRVMEVCWPSDIALQEEVSNQRALRPLTAVRGERHVKRHAEACQVWSGKMVVNICRRRVENNLGDIETRVASVLWDKSGGYPVYCPGGVRRIGSMSPDEALVWNV